MGVVCQVAAGVLLEQRGKGGEIAYSRATSIDPSRIGKCAEVVVKVVCVWHKKAALQQSSHCPASSNHRAADPQTVINAGYVRRIAGCFGWRLACC
jgi:hypothetical protein